MKLFWTIVLCGTAFLAGPAAAQDVVNIDPVKVDQNFIIDGVSWQNGRGQVNFAVLPSRTDDGTLKLCGAIQIKGPKGGNARKVPRAFEFLVDGKKVVRGFQWMPVISSREFIGSEAACRIYSKVKITTDSQIGFGLSQRRFSN